MTGNGFSYHNTPKEGPSGRSVAIFGLLLLFALAAIWPLIGWAGASNGQGSLHACGGKKAKTNTVCASGSPSEAPSPSLAPSPSPATDPSPSVAPSPTSSSSSTPPPTSSSTASPVPPSDDTSCPGVAVAPGANLTTVVNAHGAGTTYCLPPGTFTVSSVITLQDGDRVIGSGLATKIVGSGANTNLFTAVSGADVSLANLDASNARGDAGCSPGCARAINGYGSSWTISDVACHDNAAVCIGGGGADVTMIHVDCYRNGFGSDFNSIGATRSASCVKRAGKGSADDLVIRDSYIHDNYWNGAWADFHGGTVTISNTVFENNFSGGFHYEISGGWNATDHATIIDSTFIHNAWGDSYASRQAGVLIQGDQDVLLEGNIFVNNANNVAIRVNDDTRSPWGTTAHVVIRGNTLNQQTIAGSSLAGVSCSDNKV